MAGKMIPKSNIPNQYGIRELSKEEALERFRLRREGKLPMPKQDNVELLPADANRKRLRHSITVPRDVMRIARKAGAGNASRGIEIALEFWLANRKRGRKPNAT